jgi:putative membrane protein
MAVDRLIGSFPAAFAVAAVSAQIAYPLCHGTARDDVTVAIVLLFALSSASHALSTRGAAGIAIITTTLAGGFAVEVLGVHTGLPFGRYAYGSTLGPCWMGVPLLLGAAWTMLAWPAALVARRLAPSYVARVLIGAWALASWDVFLDPQMVQDGHWTWRFPSPHLPGVDRVPLTNYAGWLLVSLAVSVVLQSFLSRPVADDRVPLLLYGWTYVGSIVAFTLFLPLAAAAGWGALAMGAVTLPLVLRVRR